MLVLTYVIEGAEVQKKTLYRTAYECGNALPEAYKPYEDMDSMGQCIETDKVSSSTLMPKLRPIDLGKQSCKVAVIFVLMLAHLVANMPEVRSDINMPDNN